MSAPRSAKEYCYLFWAPIAYSMVDDTSTSRAGWHTHTRSLYLLHTFSCNRFCCNVHSVFSLCKLSELILFFFVAVAPFHSSGLCFNDDASTKTWYCIDISAKFSWNSSWWLCLERCGMPFIQSDDEKKACLKPFQSTSKATQIKLSSHRKSNSNFNESSHDIDTDFFVSELIFPCWFFLDESRL